MGKILKMCNEHELKGIKLHALNTILIISDLLVFVLVSILT